MAQITVNDLTENASADPNDFLLIWDSSAGATRKIKVSTLLGSSTGSSLSSGVPTVIRGQMGDLASMSYRQKNTTYLSKKQKDRVKTLSAENMFAGNSVVTGFLDDNLTITKTAGEETVYFNDVAITVGGAAKDVTLPARQHRGSKSPTNYKINISISEEQMVLRTGSYINYNIQVYA